MKVAIIGTGQIAQRHLNAFRNIPDVVLVAHLATSQSKADSAAHQWGGRGYTDLETLLRHEKPDAVWITVPPHQHGAYEQTLLASHIPFLVEKPLSADRQTAETIAAAIARTGTLAAVGYNWRALDTLPRLRQQLTRTPVRMVVGAFHVNTPSAVWWRHQAESGGQMVEQATHLIDLARSLIGEGTLLCAQSARVARPAYPDADIAGVSAAMIRFQPDVVGVFSATNILAQGADVRLQLMCEDTLITITRQAVTYQQGETQHTDTAQADSYEVQNRAFITAIQQHDPTRIYSTYADALHTHRLCQEIVERST